MLDTLTFSPTIYNKTEKYKYTEIKKFITI